jgi:hypothetical protein
MLDVSLEWLLLSEDVMLLLHLPVR